MNFYAYKKNPFFLVYPDILKIAIKAPNEPIDILPHLKRWGIPISLTVAYAVKPHEVWRSHTFLRLTQSP